MTFPPPSLLPPNLAASPSLSPSLVQFGRRPFTARQRRDKHNLDISWTLESSAQSPVFVKKKITLIYLCRSPPAIRYPRRSPHSNMSFTKTPPAVFNHSMFPWDCLSFCDFAPCRVLRPLSPDSVLLCAFLVFWSRRGLVAWSGAVSSASRSLLVPVPEDSAVLLGCLTPLS